MDPQHLSFDSRLKFEGCVYCGATATTKDHVPSKVFLDEPMPEDLGTVAACADCNGGISSDEQYPACLLECVLSGHADPVRLARPKIRGALRRSQALQAMLARSVTTHEDGTLYWQPDFERVRRVLVKLSMGHAAYELFPQVDEPVQCNFNPLVQFTESALKEFEETPQFEGWLEIGTRAYLRAAGAIDVRYSGKWIVVQDGMYRYGVRDVGGVLVQVVIREYLACTTYWE